MKRCSALIFLACAAWQLSGDAAADTNRLVILHTNDTHSIIDPYYENGMGGVARRKVVIDSVRKAEENVLLVDAGDVVQGSLYFTLFGGDVEQKVMNALGYDIQIPGNHEFDNGMEAMARYVEGLEADYISSNYDVRHTPLEEHVKPYTVREFDGKKIGFMGININPKGLIDSLKSEGVVYTDAIKAANAMAWYLRNIEHCDYVVAITHVGYDTGAPVSDRRIAEATEGIDIVIGGHSHTVVNPEADKALPSRFVNVAGDTVLVAQTGKYGANIGEIVLDLDSGRSDYQLIGVDSRLDGRIDEEFVEMLEPFRTPVDSVMNLKVGMATAKFDRRPALMNWMADFVFRKGEQIAREPVDMSIVNIGGIRSPFDKGPITKGEIMQAFPFDNYVVVLEIDGRNLAATLDSLAAHGGNGVSFNVRATIDPQQRRCASATINGRPIDADRTYRVATINYLAAGNDGMEPLANGKVVAASRDYLYDDMIHAFESGFLKGRKQKPDLTERMK